MKSLKVIVETTLLSSFSIVGVQNFGSKLSFIDRRHEGLFMDRMFHATTKIHSGTHLRQAFCRQYATEWDVT